MYHTTSKMSKMPDKEWFDKYENVKESLDCKVDLDFYFYEKQIGGISVDILEIGSVNFPTGNVVVCDTLVELEECPAFIPKVPIGTYPVKICIALNEEYGNRYACVKVAVTNQNL